MSTKLIGLLIVVMATLAFAGAANARMDVSAASEPSERLVAGQVLNLAASQQFESQQGTFFQDLFNCAGNEAAIADQPLQIFASVYLAFPNFGCLYPKNAGTGDLKVKWVLQFASQFGGWNKCAERAWKSNDSSTSYMDTVKQWDNLPCGHGLYRAKGYGKFYKNGTWHQGIQTTASINKQ
jgi:hypothetical protein